MSKPLHISKFILVIFLMFKISVILRSQTNNNKLDSLYQHLGSLSEEQMDYAKTLVDIANIELYYDLNTADNNISKALKLFESGQYDQDSIKKYHWHYLVKAWVLHGNEFIDSSLIYLNKAEKITEDFGSEDDKLEIRINKGALLLHSHNEEAKSYAEYLIENADTSINRNNKIQWILGHNYLAEFHRSQYRYKPALDTLLIVFRSGILSSVPDYQVGVISNISQLASKLGDTNIGRDYLNELLESGILSKAQEWDILLDLAQIEYQDDQMGVADSLLNSIEQIANLNRHHQLRLNNQKINLLCSQKLWKKAEFYLDKLDKLNEEASDKESLLRADLYRVKIWSEISRQSNAKELTDKLLSNGSITLKDSIALMKASIKSDIGKNYSSRLTQIFDLEKILEDREQLRLTKENLIAYQAERKELENLLLLQKLEKEALIRRSTQRNLNYLLLFLGFTLLLSGLLFKLYHTNKRLSTLLKSENDKLVYQKEELLELNQKLKEKLDNGGSKQNVILELKSRDKTHRVALETIMYIKSETPGTRIYLDGKSIWVDATLKELKEQIKESDRFFQCFRSIIVNIDFVSWINHSSLKLVSGTELSIGRTYKKNLSNIFNKT